MDSSSIVFGLILLAQVVFVYVIENWKDVKNRLKESMPARDIITIAIVVSLTCAILQVGYYTFFSIKRIPNMKGFLYNERLFQDVDNKILEENEYLLEKSKIGIDVKKTENPYLPDGFKHVEGRVDEGYVVSDEVGNEFVWIPCIINGNKYARFKKKDFNETPYQSKETCYDVNYEDFIDSVIENGGFYVSRYEIGTENGEYFSKPNKEIAYATNRDEAIKISSSICKGYNTQLINGLAYDTMLSWLLETNSKPYLFGDSDKILSGRNEVKNIYDVFDNIFEITDECSYGTIIKRGIDDKEEINTTREIQSRYPTMENFVIEDNLAIRVVLYK